MLILPCIYDGLKVREFLAKKSIKKLTIHLIHLIYPPCEFWLFKKFKNVLKEQRFDDIPDIQRNVITLLRAIPENDSQDSFRQWHYRLTKSTDSQGQCSENDSSP
jgi:hypothetical protein